MKTRVTRYSHDAVLCGLGAVLVAAIATADYYLDGRIAVGVCYGAVILLGMAANGTLLAFVLATLATLATLLVGLISYQEPVEVAGLVNRILAVVATWIVAAFVFALRSERSGRGVAQNLIERDQIFRALFDQTFQFIAAVDADGNIVEANQTLRDYAGLNNDEIRSMPVWRLPIFQYDAEAQERLRAAIGAAASGNFIRDEFEISGIGERYTSIDLSLKPIRDETGSILQIIMEARDITETRTQQEMLVQAQKMEAVGELTAGVAHDFNNLLTVIAGNLELLERRLEGNEMARDRLERAIAAVFRGQALTQQLLAFSRRQPLDPVVLDVNTLLNGMSRMYEALGDNVEIEFRLTDDLPLCEVDPTLLETAVLNIAINARDAMPEGGLITFETAKAALGEDYRGEVTDLEPGDYICLAVSDTGEGIPEKILAQVFDPFFTTKSADEGTGLGLSMVYGFVKQSGGDVKIISEVGKGTTVRIYLPVTEKPLPVDADTPEAGKDEARVSGKHVLLVDDDVEVRDIAYSILTEIGCRVRAATNGDEAIRLLRAGEEYDLIFTDVVMSGDAGGVDVARAARTLAPEIPVVFFSGFPRKSLDDNDELIEGALFLAKPFHRRALVNIVERAFERPG